ncbi:MAG: hypothetical protein ACP5T1_06965, partial [Thermoplasmata archaeon]
MTIVVRKKKNKNGKEYYDMVDVRRVNGNVKIKYVGYLGKTPDSKKEIELGQVLPYLTRLLSKGISQEEIREILHKIGINYDLTPITRIIIENDLKLKKTF